MKFTETKLEQVFTELLGQEGYVHFFGNQLNRTVDEVLIEDDLKTFLQTRYENEGITKNEIGSIILQLKTLSASDLYESNKKIMRWLSDGFILKREDRAKKDIHIELIDYSGLHAQRQAENLDSVFGDPGEEFNEDVNIYKFVTQMEIVGTEKRIPDGILYINGLPVVVFEFKTAIRETTTIHDAYVQLTTRYRRDIPELFKYNTFCVISDGANTKAGSFFAPYEFYYAWRRLGLVKLRLHRETNRETNKQEPSEALGIDSMYTLVQGMLHESRLRDIIRNFIFIPDSSKKDEKIVCRYPQYYAARALFESIKKAQKPDGDGKGGTYFGATGSGKSFTMLYLARLLMKSLYFENPTLVLITDRTDLDDQLSAQFINAKNFIGDNTITSVESRAQLRELLQGRASGGVFLTTIQKFTEELELLTERTNVICISDEAHRSQTNLDQKIRVTEEGVRKSYGFAKYLHDSLPNATFVGFTGTPIDATLDVFGEVVDAYTMTESVIDEITVRIVYEGRAAKVALNNSELEKIEVYYQQAEEEGASDYQIEESKKQSANMNAILGDPDRLQAVAEDFVNHYETRLKEGATVKGKAMFVCSSRQIAYDFYKKVIQITRPPWAPRSSGYDEDYKGSHEGGYQESHEEDYKESHEEGYEGSHKEDYEERSNPENKKYARHFTKSFGVPEEWYRRKIPHRNKIGLVQFITFRLADSLSQEKLRQIEEELKQLPPEKIDTERRKKMQYWLDQGMGACSLANPKMAEVIQNALFHHDGNKYDLLAWSIMPNHVHVLIKTNADLDRIIQSWKSFTGRWAMQNNSSHNLGIKKDAKRFWSDVNWDRFIRDEDHFYNTVNYILNNPYKAKLPEGHVAYLFTGERVLKKREFVGEELESSTGNVNNVKKLELLHAQLLPTQVRMVMTRHQDDPKEMYDLLGTKEDRKELERLFKDENSNFKVAIVVDMWLTGFDVPFLDTIYIDKPIRQHNLIQTISRVNRKYQGKNKGLVVDYIGIKNQMNLALKKYSEGDEKNFEDIRQSLIVFKNHLDLLDKIFYKFDHSAYFGGSPIEQLNTLNMAVEFVQQTKEVETRFMTLVKRMKAAYDICAGSDEITQSERDFTHFYLAVRSILFKLTKGDAPDTAQMNARVREMIKDALESDGVSEIYKIGKDTVKEQDLFDPDYLAKIAKIKLPNTKIKLLQKLLAKAIGELRKVNKVKGVDFSKKMESLVQRYNERDKNDLLRSEVYEEMAEQLTEMIWQVYNEFQSGDDMGISFEEKAFYDILLDLCRKYDFTYPDDKLVSLAKAVKSLVDSQSKYPDWHQRDDIKSALKVGLILLLDEHGYPPVERDEVYEEIFEQAENFKRYH